MIAPKGAMQVPWFRDSIQMIRDGCQPAEIAALRVPMRVANHTLHERELFVMRKRANGHSKAAVPDCPLVLIEWVDASRLSDSWMDWADIPDPYPHTCVSVGFLVGENGKGKILVPTIGDVKHPDNRHTYGGMMIPKSAIISERRLR